MAFFSVQPYGGYNQARAYPAMYTQGKYGQPQGMSLQQIRETLAELERDVEQLYAISNQPTAANPPSGIGSPDTVSLSPAAQADAANNGQNQDWTYWFQVFRSTDAGYADQLRSRYAIGKRDMDALNKKMDALGRERLPDETPPDWDTQQDQLLAQTAKQVQRLEDEFGVDSPLVHSAMGGLQFQYVQAMLMGTQLDDKTLKLASQAFQKAGIDPNALLQKAVEQRLRNNQQLVATAADDGSLGRAYQSHPEQFRGPGGAIGFMDKATMGGRQGWGAYVDPNALAAHQEAIGMAKHQKTIDGILEWLRQGAPGLPKYK